MDRDPPLDRESPGQRPHLDRESPGQRPPSGQRVPWTETPLWTESPMDRDPLDRESPGPRLRPPPVDRQTPVKTRKTITRSGNRNVSIYVFEENSEIISPYHMDQESTNTNKQLMYVYDLYSFCLVRKRVKIYDTY